MAHFAEIDSNNTVLRVVVTDNNKPNEGYDWLVENLGGTWVQTSYNTLGGEHLLGGTPLRKNYAGIGDIYDADRDAFYRPQPYPSWTLDEETCIWEPPVPRPTTEGRFQWDEDTTTWIEITGE